MFRSTRLEETGGSRLLTTSRGQPQPRGEREAQFSDSYDAHRLIKYRPRSSGTWQMGPVRSWSNRRGSPLHERPHQQLRACGASSSRPQIGAGAGGVAAIHEHEAPAPAAGGRGAVPAAAAPAARLRLGSRAVGRGPAAEAGRSGTGAGEGADEAAGAAPARHHEPHAGRAAATRQLPAPRPRRHERRPRRPRPRRRMDRAPRWHHLPLLEPTTPASSSSTVGPCTLSQLSAFAYVAYCLGGLQFSFLCSS
jgi:hypothetical protein